MPGISLTLRAENREAFELRERQHRRQARHWRDTSRRVRPFGQMLDAQPGVAGDDDGPWRRTPRFPTATFIDNPPAMATLDFLRPQLGQQIEPSQSAHPRSISARSGAHSDTRRRTWRPSIDTRPAAPPENQRLHVVGDRSFIFHDQHSEIRWLHCP